MPPVVQRTNSYAHLAFPVWQVQLLLTSSLSFLISGAFAGALGQRLLSLMLCTAGLCSLNYWRSPGPSLRRDADLAAAGVALAYCLFTGFWLTEITCYLGWGSLLGALSCFRHSWMLSLGHDETWAYWHAGAHVLSGVAAIALASGDVASRNTSLIPPHNVVAECSIALIIFQVLFDCLKPAAPPASEPDKQK